jgi:hypothetical protein
MQDKIKAGDEFVELDHREHGRILKVLSVFMPETYDLDEGFVACSSRGKVTIMSYKRMIDESRFEKRVEGFMGLGL